MRVVGSHGAETHINYYDGVELDEMTGSFRCRGWVGPRMTKVTTPVRSQEIII